MSEMSRRLDLDSSLMGSRGFTGVGVSCLCGCCAKAFVCKSGPPEVATELLRSLASSENGAGDPGRCLSALICSKRSYAVVPLATSFPFADIVVVALQGSAVTVKWLGLHVDFTHNEVSGAANQPLESFGWPKLVVSGVRQSGAI